MIERLFGAASDIITFFFVFPISQMPNLISLFYSILCSFSYSLNRRIMGKIRQAFSSNKEKIDEAAHPHLGTETTTKHGTLSEEHKKHKEKGMV
jgi:hypothetical protein